VRKPRNPSADASGGAGAIEDEFTVERGIEAIGLLRVQMREAGMTDCADALDEVYVQCLRDFVTRADEQVPVAEKHRKRGNGNLN